MINFHMENHRRTLGKLSELSDTSAPVCPPPVCPLVFFSPKVLRFTYLDSLHVYIHPPNSSAPVCPRLPPVCPLAFFNPKVTI